MLTVVTGWSPAGFEEYGRRFLHGFNRFWPASTQLVVYGEQPVPLGRGEFRRLDVIPGCAEFLRKYDTPAARGQVPHPGYEHRWKPKHRVDRYNFRFDAWKFCRQGFIPHHAAGLLEDREDGDRHLLCWLDGDVVTHSAIPRGFIEGLLPPGYAVAYLGRGEKHSEIGFQLYDVTLAAPMLEEFSRIYASGEVFRLKEWHSAWVFDEARRRTRVPAHDLTPGGHGHVWHQSPLRAMTDHLKGKRKAKGRSDERRT